MPLTLVSPASGTLDFGNVPVGGFRDGMITWGQTDPNAESAGQGNPYPVYNPTGPDTGETISGADAAHFVSQDGGTFAITVYSSIPPGFSTVRFSPTSITTFNAQIVLHYVDFLSGQPQVGYVTAPVLLTGAGGTPVAAGEAPAMVQSFRRELVPINGANGITLNYFNENNFNDTSDTGSYVFKAEDIIADRVPTIRRVILTYIDLGVAMLQFTITGANDNGVIVTQTTTKSIGTVAATGLLLTAFVDMAISCFRPQLTINRAANGGPIQISTVLMTGQVETEVTL